MTPPEIKTTNTLGLEFGHSKTAKPSYDTNLGNNTPSMPVVEIFPGITYGGFAHNMELEVSNGKTKHGQKSDYKPKFIFETKEVLGTSLLAKVGLGYKQEYYKGLGAEASISASGGIGFAPSTVLYSEPTSNYDKSGTYMDSFIKFATEAKVRYDTNWGGVGVGVEAGHVTSGPIKSKLPDYIKLGGDKWYVTPTLDANVKLIQFDLDDKGRPTDNHLDLTVDADMNGGNIGFRIVF